MTHHSFGYCETTVHRYIFPKTNADRIRAKTDEGLAEWMENNGDCPPIPCPYSGNDKPLTRDICLNCTLKWLKAEAGGEE